MDQVYCCKNCGIAISKEKHEKAMEIKWLPLCDNCEPEITEKFKKWAPLFQDLNIT